MTNTKLLVMYAMVGAALSAAMVSYLDPTSELSKSAVPTASAAQVDFFLKIDGITGDATNPMTGEKGWIELDSFSADSTGTGGGAYAIGSATGGAGSGKHPYEFTGNDGVTNATPAVCVSYASGKMIKNAEFDVFTTGGVDANGASQPSTILFSIHMTELKINSYHVSGDRKAGTPPAETFGFEPRTMQYTIGSSLGTTIGTSTSSTGQ